MCNATKSSDAGNTAEVRRDTWRRVREALANGTAAQELINRAIGLPLDVGYLEQVRPIAVEVRRLAAEIAAAVEARRSTLGRGMNAAAAADLEKRVAAGRRAEARLEELRAAHPDLIGDMAAGQARQLTA